MNESYPPKKNPVLYLVFLIANYTYLVYRRKNSKSQDLKWVKY